MVSLPSIQTPDTARVLDMGPFQMRVLADARQTDGAVTVLEAEEPPGFGPPLHVHDDAAEAFYVVDGEYVIFLGGQERLCPRGSFVFVPAGVEHGFRVGRVPSRKLNIYLPAAMVGYFEELAAAQAAGRSLSDAELTEAAARHAMRVLGPVPDGYL